MDPGIRGDRNTACRPSANARSKNAQKFYKYIYNFDIARHLVGQTGVFDESVIHRKGTLRKSSTTSLLLNLGSVMLLKPC